MTDSGFELARTADHDRGRVDGSESSSRARRTPAVWPSAGCLTRCCLCPSSCWRSLDCHGPDRSHVALEQQHQDGVETELRMPLSTSSDVRIDARFVVRPAIRSVRLPSCGIHRADAVVVARPPALATGSRVARHQVGTSGRSGPSPWCHKRGSVTERESQASSAQPEMTSAECIDLRYCLGRGDAGNVHAEVECIAPDRPALRTSRSATSAGSPVMSWSSCQCACADAAA